MNSGRVSGARGALIGQPLRTASVDASASQVEQIMGYGRPKLRDSLLFFLLMSGPPKFRARGINASLLAEIDWVVLMHAFVWALGALWIGFRLYPSLVRRSLLPKGGSPQVVGALLVGALAASIVFSPGRLLTAFVVAQTGIMLTFTWLFVRIYGVRSCLNHAFWSIAVIVAVIYVAWVVAPNTVVSGISGRVRGDLIAPAGSVATIGLVLCLCAIPPLTRNRLILVVGGLLSLLWLSQTRTALIAFAAFLAMGGLFGRGLPIKRTLPLLLAGFLVVGAWGMMSNVQEHLIRDTASISTLSDRVPLWNYMSERTLRESPFVGLGFYAASRVVAPEYNRSLGTAHSSFVEVFVGAGILGAGLYVLLLIMMAYQAGILLLRARVDGPILAVSAMLVVVFLLAITGTDAVQAGPVGFVFWVVAAALPALRDERRTALLARSANWSVSSAGRV